MDDRTAASGAHEQGQGRGVRAAVVRLAPFAALTLAFTASRVAWRSAGFAFHDGCINATMQLLDLTALRDRLGESLVHLHSQPPLYNAVVGILLKAFPDDLTLALEVLHLALGAGAALLAAGTMTRLGVGRWTSVALASAFTSLPQVVLYENLPFYPHWCLFLLLLASHCLAGAGARPVRAVTCAVWAVAALALTRSLYHPLFVALTAAGVVVTLPRSARRAAIRLSLLPCAVVAAWVLKNAILFSVAGTSSWGGLGFHAVARAGVPTSEVLTMVEDGRLSRYSAIPRFAPPEVVMSSLGIPDVPAGVDVLDHTRKTPDHPGEEPPVNYNHRVYPEAARHAVADAVTLVGHDPLAFLATLRRNFDAFFEPVLSSDMVRGDSARARALAGPIEAAAGSPVGKCIIVVVIGGALLGVVGRRPRPLSEVLFLRFAVATMAWVTLASIAFEVGENNRFRQPLIGLFVVLVGLAARDARGWVTGRLLRRPVRPPPPAL